MAEPENPLPLNWAFFPSDHELISYFLVAKNNGDQSNAINVIREIKLYNYSPFQLPLTAAFLYGRGGRKRHWHYYVARIDNEGRRRRRAAGGYWEKKGRARDVVDAKHAVVGTQKCFVFYFGEEGGRALRTNWVMFEYSLNDQPMASFVLCRLFFKSQHQNSAPQHMLSSGDEESVVTDIDEPELLDLNSADHENEVSGFPVENEMVAGQAALGHEQMVAENLYQLVDQLEHEHVAKVTGVLLEMDQSEVLHLLESPVDLKAKVTEAMVILRNANQGTGPSE